MEIEKWVVCLRNLSGSPDEPCEMFLELRGEIDWDDHETEHEHASLAATLAEFCERVERDIGKVAGAVDVYIGWWGNQGTFEIPQRFFRLIAERGWKVAFDIND